MVGTGVFTSLGFQLDAVQSGFALMMLWLLGGVIALCGALCYGELASALPRSGGEFHFLGRIYHPAVGFLAGWVSFIMGFTLPIALAAMAFGSYFAGSSFGAVIPASPVVTSCVLVLLVTLAHTRDLRVGSWFQNLFTAFKLLLIVALVVAAGLLGKGGDMSFAPRREDFEVMLTTPYAVSLLYVLFAYTGWNAAVYVLEEVEDPRRTVPRSLITATLLVTVLYLALNAAFLLAAPIDALRGQLDVGHVAASYLFGEAGGRWMSAALSLALVSTVSAMVWAGPRVTQTIGEDYGFFRGLARTNARGIPAVALWLQTAIVIVLLVTSTFETLLVYTQFTLALSSALAVYGVMRLRRIAPDLPRPVRAWGYPWTPLVFLGLSLWTLAFTLIDRPLESLAGLGTVLSGLLVYRLSPRSDRAPGALAVDRDG